MDEVKQRISEILDGVSLDRKARATKKEKEEFTKLSAQVAGLKKDIDKLSLRLWHACYKNDYHSLPPEAAREELRRIKHNIDTVISSDTVQ